MIIDSSKDYSKNEILIHYEGDEPSRIELNEFIEKRYGGPQYKAQHIIISRSEPTEHNGLKNPGSIVVKQIWI